jgi:porin
MMTRFVALLAVLAVAAGVAGAEESPEKAPAGLLDRETLTDGWLGAGRALAERGVSLSLGVTHVYQLNLSGGLATHKRAGRHAGSYDLELDIDTDKLFGLRGGRIYALAEGSWSDGLDAGSIGSVGGFEVNADAAGCRPIDLTQLWYEQSLPGAGLRFRVGKLDLTGGFECHGCPVAFDGNSFANDEAEQFLNAALVNNPTIPFPDCGLGVVVYLEPAEGVYLSAGVADAQADARETGFNTAFHDEDYFLGIFEFGFAPRLPGPRGPLQGAYRFGLWWDRQDKPTHAGGTRRHDLGFYLSFDQVLYRENDVADDDQGLGAFARYGFAHHEANDVRNFWSAGLQYRGLLPGRDADVIGFGVASGRLVRAAGFDRHTTTVGEIYYNVEIAPWLHVSPSLQYVCNPGGTAAANHALVVGVRVQAAL